MEIRKIVRAAVRYSGCCSPRAKKLISSLDVFRTAGAVPDKYAKVKIQGRPMFEPRLLAKQIAGAVLYPDWPSLDGY